MAHLKFEESFIWNAHNVQSNLHGAALGAPDGESTNNLFLPSRGGRAGDDHEMWFWVVTGTDHKAAVVSLSPATHEKLIVLLEVGPVVAARIVGGGHLQPLDAVEDPMEIRRLGRRGEEMAVSSDTRATAAVAGRALALSYASQVRATRGPETRSNAALLASPRSRQEAHLRSFVAIRSPRV